jgi:hypothetical protein
MGLLFVPMRPSLGQEDGARAGQEVMLLQPD